MRHLFRATRTLLNKSATDGNPFAHLFDKLPLASQHAPFVVRLEEGKKYSWCTCGLTEKQAFCDGK